MILYVYKPPIIASHQKVDPITLSLFHPAGLVHFSCTWGCQRGFPQSIAFDQSQLYIL